MTTDTAARADRPPITHAIREHVLTSTREMADQHTGLWKRSVSEATIIELCDQVDSVHEGLERELEAEHALAEQLGKEAEAWHLQAEHNLKVAEENHRKADRLAIELARVSDEVATEERQPVADPVNHPSHYTQGRWEVIDVIEDALTFEGVEGYLVGNVLKYVMRYRHKNGVEDLRKARWYLDRLISRLEADDGLR